MNEAEHISTEDLGRTDEIERAEKLKDADAEDEQRYNAVESLTEPERKAEIDDMRRWLVENYPDKHFLRSEIY